MMQPKRSAGRYHQIGRLMRWPGDRKSTSDDPDRGSVGVGVPVSRERPS
jgi:hypothetical protein